MSPISLEINGSTSFFHAGTASWEDLTEEERAVSDSYHPNRRTEFATGRYCARMTMKKLGLKPVSIPIGVNRQPLWPADVTGSISHTKGLTGALMARKMDFRSVGIDIEGRRKVEPLLWHQLFTENEYRMLDLAGTNDAAELATLFFSLKESFYKMQFPLTGRFLDFRDVELQPMETGYRISVLQGLEQPEILRDHRLGFMYHEAFVITWALAE
jgi:4'-phosphopantetheinyl transferase EntD